RSSVQTIPRQRKKVMAELHILSRAFPSGREFLQARAFNFRPRQKPWPCPTPSS
ncbi:hypothetical protein JB92DRAFT_2997289, partial [Gautieria morchelliformis]